MKSLVMVPAVLCLVVSATRAEPPKPAPPANEAIIKASTQTISPPGTTLPATTRPTTIAVRRGNLPLKFEANAYFEAVDPVEVRLRFKQYAGELNIISIVGNGTAVKKGDSLFNIDPAPLQKLLDAAENDLAAAQATLGRLEAEQKLSDASEALKLKTQSDAVHDAEDAVKYWETVDGPQMLKNWDLALQQYQYQVDDRSDELEQLRKMYKSEELTSATADIVVKRALRGLDHAKVSLGMEKERIAKAKETTYPASKRIVEDALTRVRQVKAQQEIASNYVKQQWVTNLVASRAAVAGANQKASELRTDLPQLSVVAPDDGVVWYGQMAGGNWVGGDPKALRAGEKLTAGQVPLTFLSPMKLRVVADLPEARFFSVPSGTAVTIIPVSFPGLRMQSTIEAAPRTGVTTQDRGVVYPLRINIGDVDPRILPGLRATARFDIPAAEQLLLIPAASVSAGEVWVMGKDGSESKRAIVTGRTDGKVLEVVSGLSEGEEVLTQPKGAN